MESTSALLFIFLCFICLVVLGIVLALEVLHFLKKVSEVYLLTMTSKANEVIHQLESIQNNQIDSKSKANDIIYQLQLLINYAHDDYQDRAQLKAMMQEDEETYGVNSFGYPQDDDDDEEAVDEYEEAEIVDNDEEAEESTNKKDKEWMH